MSKRDWATFVVGLIIGILLAIVAVLVKDTIVFHNQCDGVVVQKDWGGYGRYCIDPAVLANAGK